MDDTEPLLPTRMPLEQWLRKNTKEELIAILIEIRRRGQA